MNKLVHESLETQSLVFKLLDTFQGLSRQCIYKIRRQAWLDWILKRFWKQVFKKLVFRSFCPKVLVLLQRIEGWSTKALFSVSIDIFTFEKIARGQNMKLSLLVWKTSKKKKLRHFRSSTFFLICPKGPNWVRIEKTTSLWNEIAWKLIAQM